MEHLTTETAQPLFLEVCKTGLQKDLSNLSELRAGLLEHKVGERICKGLLEESYSLFTSLIGHEVCYMFLHLSICDEILLMSNIFKIIQC